MVSSRATTISLTSSEPRFPILGFSPREPVKLYVHYKKVFCDAHTIVPNFVLNHQPELKTFPAPVPPSLVGCMDSQPHEPALQHQLLSRVSMHSIVFVYKVVYSY